MHDMSRQLWQSKERGNGEGNVEQETVASSARS